MGFLLAKETALFGDAKKPATANAVSIKCIDQTRRRPSPLRANPIQELISAVSRTTNSGRVPGAGAAQLGMASDRAKADEENLRQTAFEKGEWANQPPTDLDVDYDLLSGALGATRAQ